MWIAEAFKHQCAATTRTPPTPAFSSTFSHHSATSSLRTCKPAEPFLQRMILFPSILLLLPSLSLAVPLPLDQEVSTYIRGYNYKVSEAAWVLDTNIHIHSFILYESHYCEMPPDAIQRRVEDKLQPILQQPDPQPASGCSSTWCSCCGGEAPEAGQGGRLPFQRQCQRQYQLSRILDAWMCLTRWLFIWTRSVM